MRGVSGAAGDGRASTRDPPPAVEVPVAPAAPDDAGQDAAGEGGGTGKEATRDATARSPLPGTVTDDEVSAPPAVSVVPEIVEIPSATSRTGADLKTSAPDAVTTATRRCMSALPAARHGNQPLYLRNLHGSFFWGRGLGYIPLELMLCS